MQRNIVKLSGATFHIFIVCIGCILSVTPYHIHHYCEIILFCDLILHWWMFSFRSVYAWIRQQFWLQSWNWNVYRQFSNPLIYNILLLYWVEPFLTTPSLNVYLRRPCKQEAKPSCRWIELLLIKSLCLFDRQTSERASIWAPALLQLFQPHNKSAKVGWLWGVHLIKG